MHMRLEGCRHTSEPNIFWLWVARDSPMGLIKWRYIWRYVTAENIKNIIKTVGYVICSVEPVATTFSSEAQKKDVNRGPATRVWTFLFGWR